MAKDRLPKLEEIDSLLEEIRRNYKKISPIHKRAIHKGLRNLVSSAEERATTPFDTKKSKKN